VTIDQDKDVLAAEYVLGTLGPEERAEAQALIAIDSGFAEVVRSWERRLGELSAMVDPVEPPPDMWDRIKVGMAAPEKGAAEPLTPIVGAAKPPAEAAKPAAEAPATKARAAPPDLAEPSADPGKPSADNVRPGVEPAKPAADPVQRVAAGVSPQSEPRAAGKPLAPDPVVEVALRAALAANEAAEPLTSDRPSEPRPSIPRFPAAPPPESSGRLRREPSADVVPLARSRGRWRASAMALAALAACLLALVLVQETNPDLLPAQLQPKAKVVETVRTVEIPSPKPAEFVAVLQKDAASPAFLLTFDLEKRMLTVRAVGAEHQAGKSYELWLISDKFSGPKSLGVIGGGPYTVRPTDPNFDAVTVNRATYAVSLEPEGGSPTGAPTGPVLYSGRLLEATAPDFPARAP